MNQDETLRKLEGLHTIETVVNTIGGTKGSALVLLSRLKKQGYVTVTGGGKIKRLYKISQCKQRERSPGMYDIINKYSPHLKIAPPYDHQVHGRYGPEEALVDAVQTQSIRVLLASLFLYNHITDWPRLRALAKKEDCWQQVGALYEVARKYMRVRTMPASYGKNRFKRWKKVGPLHVTALDPITKYWKVHVSFNENDVRSALYAYS